MKNLAEITNSMLNNIEISFTKPNESFEYDILIPLRDEKILDIEITDYQSTKDEIRDTYDTLKSKLILSTIDKAQRLGATVSLIAKGFPQPIFEQVKELAISRNVTLLSEDNYKKAIEDKIMEVAIQGHKETRGSSRFRLALEQSNAFFRNIGNV